MSDELWEFIQLFLPTRAGEGKGSRGLTTGGRSTTYSNVLKTGIPWNDLPEERGDDVTAWRRLRDSDKKGVWKSVMDALVARGFPMDVRDRGLALHRQRHHTRQKGGGVVGLTVTRGSRSPRYTRP